MANVELTLSPTVQHDTQPTIRWDTRAHMLLIIILLLAAAIRLPYMPLMGHPDLLYFNGPWAQAIQERGLFGIYRNSVAVNYPPLYLIMLGVMTTAHPISTEPLLDYFDPELLNLLKTIPIVSELLLITAIYYWLPRGNPWRWLIAVILTLCPGLIETSAFWGQADAMLALLLTICLMALNRKRLRWSWVFFDLALLMKFQAIILLPLLACLSLRRYGLKRTGAALVIAALLMGAVLLPFIIVSGWAPAMYPYIGAVDYYPSTTLNAYNLWHILDIRKWNFRPGLPRLFEFMNDTVLLFGQVSYKNAGLGLFAGYALLILTAVWRKYQERHEFVWAAALYLGFFMLPTQIHERYLYQAAVLSLIGVAQDRRCWPVALGILFTYSYNILVVVQKPFDWLGINLLYWFHDISLQVSLLNLILLAWLGWAAISRPRSTGVGSTACAVWWRRDWSEAVQRRAGRVIWGVGGVAAGLLVLSILGRMTPHWR
jgi:Gpi18-like mannosyltransferase